MAQESDVVVVASKSVVRYTPKTEMDFGSLVCWASNEVGLGVPCVYHLLPIGPPEPPTDCHTYNITYSSLQVRTLPSGKVHCRPEACIESIIYSTEELPSQFSCCWLTVLHWRSAPVYQN